MTTRAASLPSRAIHIRIVPRPANLSESREILRVLQRFGEINTYKHLRYEYHNPADNSALAIFRSPDAAQKALNASPIRFALEREVSAARADVDVDAPGEGEEREGMSGRRRENAANAEAEADLDLDAPSPLLTPSASSPSTPTPTNTHATSSTAQPPIPPPRQTTTKHFSLTLDRSRAIHQDYIERQPLWKQFSPMKSMAHLDLVSAVPHPGLADTGKRPPNAHRTPNKVLKVMAGWVDGWGGLRGLAAGRDWKNGLGRVRDD